MVASISDSQLIFRRFVDEGDKLLGEALLTSRGRHVFSLFREGVNEGLSKFQASIDLADRMVGLSGDDRVVFLKMIEKACSDWIQEKLRR